MTAKIIRLMVDLATGETISREEAGEKEIAEKVGERYYNIKGDQDTWTSTLPSSAWTLPSA